MLCQEGAPRDAYKTTVSQIASLLVAGKYDELATLTHSVRLNAKDIATAVADYGRTLIAIPDEGFETIDIVEIANASPPRWSIALPLWTQEEGRSDLTLEMTVIERDNRYCVELDDLHVL